MSKNSFTGIDVVSASGRALYPFTQHQFQKVPVSLEGKNEIIITDYLENILEHNNYVRSSGLPKEVEPTLNAYMKKGFEAVVSCNCGGYSFEPKGRPTKPMWQLDPNSH